MRPVGLKYLKNTLIAVFLHIIFVANFFPHKSYLWHDFQFRYSLSSFLSAADLSLETGA